MTVFELIKLSLFTNDMIVYMEDPKDSTRNFLKLINTFSKVAGYNTNIKKSVALLCTNDKHTEKEIIEIITFT